MKLSKNDFIKSIISDIRDEHILDVDYEKGIIIASYPYTLQDYEDGYNGKEPYNYNKQLGGILFEEYEKSKKLIDQAVLENDLLINSTKANNYF